MRLEPRRYRAYLAGMARAQTVATAEHTYTAVFEPAEEGGYVVSFPALPGIATQGETLEEARAMAADLLKGYLEILHEDGRPLPPTGRHRSCGRKGS